MSDRWRSDGQPGLWQLLIDALEALSPLLEDWNVPCARTVKPPNSAPWNPLVRLHQIGGRVNCRCAILLDKFSISNYNRRVSW